MIKRVLFFAAFSAASLQVSAADFGIGVSVQSDDSWIYAPIDVTPGFRIEPSLRYIDSDSSSRNTEADFGFPVTLDARSESQSYELAVGLFKLSSISESIRLYYGARLAYVDGESELTVVGSFPGGGEQVLQTEKASRDGYRISPTLGVEYRFNEHFSIGGEAEWFYQDIDSEIEFGQGGYYTGTGSSNAKANGTDTRLIVRYTF